MPHTTKRFREAHKSASCARLGALCATAIAVGCASSDGKRPAPLETQNQDGFSISERVRVGLGVRADFDEAVRRLSEEDLEGGIELLEEITDAEPHVTNAHIDLGIAYQRLGRLEDAEVALRVALQISPRHPAAHNELGIVYRKSGRFAEARASYERALEIYPDFHFARRNLAILCDLYLAEPACAIEHYELYTQAVPDDEKAAMWVADVRRRFAP